MSELQSSERQQLRVLSELSYCNPFEPVRIELEQKLLGDAYEAESLHAWSRTEATSGYERRNVVTINERAMALAEQLLGRQEQRGPLRGDDADLYDDLLTYTLYYRHIAVLSPPQLRPSASNQITTTTWRGFRDERERFFKPVGVADRERLPSSAHLFACLHQVRRAFVSIFDCLIGESAPSTRLRAAVWQSIFTHDLRRYRRTLYNRMGELATLITGPSGSGKELVAQAVGRSQYWPFDEKKEAFVDPENVFTALNLSALSPTLIESELFGHSKGAFTGATSSHAGWLERCPPCGAVFLDEIGELDPAIQVKLLRVAQSRDYSRLGESKTRRFAGKLIAATNRNLATEMQAGRFREDLYYRLCSDRLVVPSLHEQLTDHPEAITGLIRFLTRRLLGEASANESEAETLVNEVGAWITKELPSGYSWPGNIRELEQCVRSIVVRREYRPAATETARDARPEWLLQVERGELTANGLLGAYCRHVYDREGGYEQAARVLGLDRRTVKSHIENTPTG